MKSMGMAARRALQPDITMGISYARPMMGFAEGICFFQAMF